MSWIETVNSLKDKLANVKTSQRLVRIDIPWALRDVLSDEVTKEEFQLFVSADGLNTFFDCWIFLLEKADEEGVAFMLDVLGHWMTVQVRSFDETLGVQPLLIYFLCERDELSIDINWVWRSATRFPRFLQLIFKTIETCPKMNIQTSHILVTVLTKFPYSRVTPTVYAVCGEEGRASQIFELAIKLEAPLPLRSGLLVSYFTLGLGICFNDLYRWVPAMLFQRRHLFPHRRCPCSFCELLRRADRVAKSRDEFGIEAAFPVANSIVSSSLKAGVIPIVGDLLKEAFKAEDEVASDRALQHLVLIINLALKHGRDSQVHQLLPILVANIKWEAIGDRFDVKLGGFGPGWRSLLCLAARLSCESPESDLQNQLHEILIESSKQIILNTHGAGARDCRPEMFWWMQPMSSLCLSSYLNSREVPPEMKGVENLPADVYVCLWTDQDSIIILNAIVALADRLNEIHIDTTDKLGNMSRMSSMVTLICLACDGYPSMNVQEARRRVVAPPSPRSGLLLQSGRRLRELYGRLFALEGCVFVRNLLDVAILRAEQGSAILRRDMETAKSEHQEAEWIAMPQGARA